MRHYQKVAWAAAAAFFVLAYFRVQGQTWTKCTNAPVRSWYSVACSTNGSKLIVGCSPGPVYTSTDTGQTWVSNNLPSKNWCAVTCSSDFTRLAAATTTSGAQIWISSDAGTNWTLSGAPTSSLQNYSYLASSADGLRLAATGALLSTGVRAVYTSTDGGSPGLPIRSRTIPGTAWHRLPTV